MVNVLLHLLVIGMRSKVWLSAQLEVIIILPGACVRLSVRSFMPIIIDDEETVIFSGGLDHSIMAWAVS